MRIDRREFLRWTASSAALTLLGCERGSEAPREIGGDEDGAARSAARTGSGLLSDPRFGKHRTGPGHPESPERLKAVAEGLAPLEKHLTAVEPRLAAVEQLRRCHTETYVRTVRRDVAAGRRSLSTGDTRLSPASYEIARLAAGGASAAVDAVLDGNLANAFCALRPPGHHARPGVGMGFCIFNNVAIAAHHARASGKVKRVLIVDWDVHHGNGTQEIFYEDPDVLFFSVHQSPWYPGTGADGETGRGAGEGTTINCPLPAGSGRTEVFKAFEKKLLPAAGRFEPELVLISAGFDSRKGDPLGRFALTDRDFADLTDMLCVLADEHADGRVVSFLEGGYHLEGLASAARAHVEALHKAGSR